MEFYLLDVKSVVKAHGTELAFDYINTYHDYDTALKEALVLSTKDTTVDVSVHKWILKPDGTQEHTEGKDSVPYHYQNPNRV